MFHPLAAALGGQRLFKNLQKGEGHSAIDTVQLIATMFFFFFCFFLQYIKNQVEHSQRKTKVVMYLTVFGKKSNVLHVSLSLESPVFMSPSAHFTLSHEMNVVHTVCQLRVLVN